MGAVLPPARWPGNRKWIRICICVQYLRWNWNVKDCHNKSVRRSHGHPAQTRQSAIYHKKDGLVGGRGDHLIEQATQQTTGQNHQSLPETCPWQDPGLQATPGGPEGNLLKIYWSSVCVCARGRRSQEVPWPHCRRGNVYLLNYASVDVWVTDITLTKTMGKKTNRRGELANVRKLKEL